MSYFNPLMASTQPQGSIQHPTGTGYTTRDVDPNALVSTQLNNLLRSDSPYVTQARGSAQRQAASRGLLNSTMAAGAGEAAAIQSGLPIASQDAATYGQTDADNMAAANEFLLNQGQWATQQNIANTSAAAARANAELNYRANMAQLAQQGSQWDQDFAREGEQYDTDWEREVQRAILGNQLGQQTGLNASLYNTIFSNPEYMRDPSGSSGMMNFWQNDFGGRIDSQLDAILAQLGITLPGGEGDRAIPHGGRP
jgi:hypothetical protein